VRCTDCHAEKLVAFSCKRRGFCPSCGARRMAESAALLVDEVLPEVPMRQWVLSVPFPLRFLFASNPAAVSDALGVVYRAIAGFLIHKAGLTQAQAQCGAITLIQRFSSALNLNVHFHMPIPDGVYLIGTHPPYLRPVAAPTAAELQVLVQRISERLGLRLERKGLLVRDAESSHLDLESGGGEDALSDLQGHSITYRIALGPHKGRKAFMLQSLPPSGEERGEEQVAQVAGFSLHGGVAAAAHQRQKLERLCPGVSRACGSPGRLVRLIVPFPPKIGPYQPNTPGSPRVQRHVSRQERRTVSWDSASTMATLDTVNSHLPFGN
jgi:transposase-like zinc-binding protein/putative transposase